MALQTFTTGQVLTAAQVNALQANDYNQAVSTKTVSYVLVAADVGTRVVMNAAGATTITVNTALFAAGDTLQILNIGAGVTTITAGTATVSTSSVLALSQYDAGTLYFTSTGVSIWMMVDAADTSAAAAGTLTGATLASNVLASSLTSFGTTPTLTTPKITTYTTNGDLVYGTGSSVITRLGIGSSSQVLTVTGGVPVWATPASGSTFIGCSLYKTANQTVATATDTSILFDGEHYDTDGFHSTSVNTERITIPAGKSGYYAISAKLSYSSNTSGIRQCPVYINGLATNTGSDVRGSMTGDNTPQFVIFRYLTAADYIFISAYQNSGATLNVQGTGNNYSYTYLQVTYLGA